LIDLYVLGCSPHPYTILEGAAAIAWQTLKRVGIGMDDIEREKIAILMLET